MNDREEKKKIGVQPAINHVSKYCYRDYYYYDGGLSRERERKNTMKEGKKQCEKNLLFGSLIGL